tara:strand:- start:2175 stop:2318 length:144 start_codon:yes stop_codon:yes gene_type:complete
MKKETKKGMEVAKPSSQSKRKLNLKKLQMDAHNDYMQDKWKQKRYNR